MVIGGQDQEDDGISRATRQLGAGGAPSRQRSASGVGFSFGRRASVLRACHMSGTRHWVTALTGGCSDWLQSQQLWTRLWRRQAPWARCLRWIPSTEARFGARVAMNTTLEGCCCEPLTHSSRSPRPPGRARHQTREAAPGAGSGLRIVALSRSGTPRRGTPCALRDL
jgi:hypothetical protein